MVVFNRKMNPLDGYVLGGSKRSGFIASLIAKKEAGKDFDPTANKSKKPKKGLVPFNVNKVKLVSDSIIDDITKSTSLKKWREDTKEKYEKEKEKNPDTPNPGLNPAVEGMSKVAMLKLLTLNELRELTKALRGQLNKKGQPKTKAELISTLSGRGLEVLRSVMGGIVPAEKLEAIDLKLYPMWRNPSSATRKRATEKEESKEKRLRRAREYKGERKERETMSKEDKDITGAGAPPEKLFYQSAKASYDSKAPDKLNGYTKIADTPTLDAYLRPADKSILIASRGTNISSFNDLKADASLVANNLVNTNRYEEDKNALVKIMEQYPPELYEYYLSGHSLAGAIVSQLKRDFPFLKMAVVYNPAFQTKDLTQQPQNVKRYYTDKDFLYNLGGKFFRNNIVIPADKEQATGFFQRIKSALTPSGITGHSLSNFEKVYKGQGKEMVEIPIEDLKKEHTELVNVLTKPTKKKLKKEAEKQSKELKKYSGKGITEAQRRDLIKIAEAIYFYALERAEGKTLPLSKSLPPIINADINKLFTGLKSVEDTDAKGGDKNKIHWTNPITGEYIEVVIEKPNDLPLAKSIIERHIDEELSDAYPEGLPEGSDYKPRLTKGKGKPISIARKPRTSRQLLPSELARQSQLVKSAREEYYKTLPPQETLEEAQLRPLKNNPLGQFAFEVAKFGQNVVKPVVREALNLIPETKGLKELKEIGKSVLDALPEEKALRNERMGDIGRSLAGKVADFSPVQKQARQLGLVGDGRKKTSTAFEDIKWGTFERLFKKYKKDHPYSKVKDLEGFAKHIGNNPKKFSKSAQKKASFYLNVIKKD